MKCESCNSAFINGVFCHEHGCPDKWKSDTRECQWCGSDFKPGDRDQLFCEHSCACSYNGEAYDLDNPYDGVEDYE